MTDDFKRLIDGDEEERGAARFGRNRFLRVASGALFALTVPAVMSDPAVAAPYPCFGYPGCGRACCGCGGGCTKVYTCGGNQCWYTAASGATYRCCDWRKRDGNLCIMSTRTGTLAGSSVPRNATVVPAGTRP